MFMQIVCSDKPSASEEAQRITDDAVPGGTGKRKKHREQWGRGKIEVQDRKGGMGEVSVRITHEDCFLKNIYHKPRGNGFFHTVKLSNGSPSAAGPVYHNINIPVADF